MSELNGVTQAQFFEAHRQVMDKMQDLHRSQTARIEAVKDDLRLFTVAFTKPVAEHGEKLRGHEKRLDDAEVDIKDVTKKSYFASGVGAILAIIVGIIPFPWKH